MSTRRSARLQKLDNPEPVEVLQPPATAELVKNKKRKAPADQTGETTRGKKRATKSAADNENETPVEPLASPANGTLSSLPPEILNMILNNIKDPSSMGKLGRTCKGYHAFMMPRLHKRLSVAAMFHAHIAKLIRALEPHLTISQKKQLRREGKYKGQQERYSSKLDPFAKPVCANYVRQIVVGVVDPGRKHEGIVHRYIDEAFRNMDNLEIIETRVLTRSMGERIASQKNLQALSLFTKDADTGAMEPLGRIKNLKHLNLEAFGYNRFEVKHDKSIQSILLNSRSTLQSLAVKTSSFMSNFLQDWEKRKSEDHATTNQPHDLTALKSLTLKGQSFDEDFIKSLRQAIDFIGLRELTLRHLSEGKHLLFNYLISLTTSSESPATEISLRSLQLDMADDRYGRTPEQLQVDFETKCRFIASFNTLTTLILDDYNQYSTQIAVNPGLSNTLLQAILKHEHLRTLKISYIGIISNRKIPYLSAETVATIVDNLPDLQEFEFAPEEEEIDEIGKALSRGDNLTSLTCYPHESWAGYPRPDDPGFTILSGILQGFLSRGGGSGRGKFVWEDHFKLKRVSVHYRAWDVASKFGKPQKGMKKAQSMKSDGDGKRQVLHRDITGTFHQRIHVGYDPAYAWVEKVAGD
ncbi:hypothetical protein G7Z17_g49 [Cylindrodendrum hubeiense]|uniref:F-box domain-containing protein n=1 Tax=Cylindrodendrum hubeiense TaxID=595255 RepID=A0A9P5LDQ2_9HYPO|nr:hypothetical protein G7Z17_g49 [Cylindrodendrum hubeiense]